MSEHRHQYFFYVLQFNANVEQRAKYADEPKKFLDSELDLDEAVRAMNVGCITS
jgi:hypothetical protein